MSKRKLFGSPDNPRCECGGLMALVQRDAGKRCFICVRANCKRRFTLDANGKRMKKGNLSFGALLPSKPIQATVLVQRMCTGPRGETYMFTKFAALSEREGA